MLQQSQARRGTLRAPRCMFAVSASCAVALWASVANAQGQASTATPEEPQFATQPPSVPLLKNVPLDPPLTAVNTALDPLPANAPRAPSDPRNLEGVWINGHPFYPQISRTIYGTPVPFTAASAKIVTDRVQTDLGGRPIGNQASGCRPPGAFHYYRLNFPILILQTKSSTYLLSEQYHGLWEVRMNQQHRTRRSNSGDSIGHWDGDTLVIETTNFSEPLWLDMAGTPMSPDARMTYRLRKIDDNQALEIITTVDDPSMYSAPWSFANRLVWRPDRFLGEYNCELQLQNGGERALGNFTK
jgi:hypothetical protein